ncbi:MAG: c-type cytochrome [Planctomycetes bacterium]|nr:c-type cytochrome [Planctomycetota bacterium]
MLPIVEQPGDAVRGKDLFQQNCATCHVSRRGREDPGPDLTGMGSHGARALLPVILDPNASVRSRLEHVWGNDRRAPDHPASSCATRRRASCCARQRRHGDSA